MKNEINITSDITNACNSRCAICYLTYRKQSEPRIFMSPEKFALVARKLQPYRGSISLSCGFEPFIHPEAAAIIRLCGPLSDFAIRINSNGIAMDRKIQEALLDSSVRLVVISLDAVSKELNRAIRGNDKLEQIIDQIRSFIRMRKACCQTFPLLSLRMTLHELNLPELPDMVRLAVDMGVDRLDVQLMAPVKDAIILNRPAESVLLDTGDETVQTVLRETQILAADAHFPITLPCIRSIRPSGAEIWAQKKTTSAMHEGFHIQSNGWCRSNVFNVDVTGAPITENCGNIFDHTVEDLLTASRKLRLCEDHVLEKKSL